MLNLIRWCRQKQSDLDLLCFQKRMNRGSEQGFCLWQCSLAITCTGRVDVWFCGFNVQEHPKVHRF